MVREHTDISRGAYLFVGVTFTMLGLAFLASTASIYHEFHDHGWLDLVITHSHLFIFFPTLGLLTLAAFYLPSVVFTDFYWHHVKPLGKPRFIAGLIVVVGTALFFANSLNVKPLRAVWEVAPAALERDRALGPVQVPNCTDGAASCGRQPIARVVADLRTEGQKRNSISEFARQCNPDSYLEVPEANKARRYCFPAKAMLVAGDCCRVQAAFSAHVADQWRTSASRSRAADLDVYLLPFKVFFVVVLVVIGILLAFWRDRLTVHYRPHVPAIERGVVVGAIAMLFWPLMDYGYQQTSDVMFGREASGPPIRLSLVIGPWAALLLFYFMKRFGEGLERVAQISTIAASAVAILRYQEINDWSARLLGSGAAWWHFAALVVLMIFGLYVLLRPWKTPRRNPSSPSSTPIT